MLERYINKNSYVELVLKDEIPEENLSSGIPFINDKRITILEIYKLIQTIKRSSAEGILVIKLLKWFSSTVSIISL